MLVCFTSGPDLSLPNLKLITVVEMTAALLGCHPFTTGNTAPRAVTLQRQELGHTASPISATGTAQGDPALGGAGRGAGTHRGEPGSPTCQLCHPGCSQTQSAPQSVYVCKVLFAAQQTKCTSAPLLCTLQHTFECFYSKIVGLLARVGGERAELSVWAGGSVGA